MAPGRLNVVIAVPHRLNWLSLLALLRTSPRIGVLGGGYDLEVTSSYFDNETAQVDAAILGATFPMGKAFDAAQQMLSSGQVKAVGILDYVPTFGRARRAHGIPGCTYLTGDDTVDDIVDRLLSLIKQAGGRGETLPDRSKFAIHSPMLAAGATAGDNDNLHLQIARYDQHGLFRLTPRELEVLARLAVGSTVPETASEMGLAASAIDNHKTNLAKKLGGAKKAELVRIAIEGGLIDLYPTNNCS